MISVLNRRVLARLFVLLFFSSAYFWLFVLSYETYYESVVTFVNVPDNLRYIYFIEYGFEDFVLSGINNYSIVFFYSILSKLLPVDIEILSFFVNLFILVFSYLLTEKIFMRLTGTYLSRLYLVVFMVLLPFVLMVNKDVFVVLYFLMILNWWFNGGGYNFVIIMVLSLLKIQLAPIFFLFLFLNYSGRYGGKVFIVSIMTLYVFLSLVSSYFSSLVFDLSEYPGVGNVAHLKSVINEDFFFLGDLLFNILLPIQFLYDLILSVRFGDDALLVVISMFKIIFLIFIVLNIGSLSKATYAPFRFIKNKSLFPCVCLLISFYLVTMVSPIINYRYFLSCAPVLIIFVGIFTRISKYEKMRVDENIC